MISKQREYISNKVPTNEKTQMLNINLIKVDESKRMRMIGDITPIKESIENIGFLINPITIDTDNNLIAGYHRYLACKELGQEEVPVRVIDKNINKELVEIDENLIRNNLTILETAQQLLKRKSIYETMYPNSKLEVIKRNNFASVYTSKSFTKDMSEKLEKSQRWVQNHIQIAENLSPESIKQIKNTLLENNFILLQNIAKKEPKEQLEFIQNVLSGNKKKKVSKQLSIKYKIDFVLRKVVVDGKWYELPNNYDMSDNSYNQMIKDIRHSFNIN